MFPSFTVFIKVNSLSIESGALIERIPIKEDFDLEKFISSSGKSAIPLFLINDGNTLTVFAADNPPTPQTGQVLISLVNPANEKNQVRAYHKFNSQLEDAE